MLRRFPSCNAASLVLTFIFVIFAFYRARNYNRLVINGKPVGLGSGGESESFLFFFLFYEDGGRWLIFVIVGGP